MTREPRRDAGRSRHERVPHALGSRDLASGRPTVRGRQSDGPSSGTRCRSRPVGGRPPSTRPGRGRCGIGPGRARPWRVSELSRRTRGSSTAGGKWRGGTRRKGRIRPSSGLSDRLGVPAGLSPEPLGHIASACGGLRWGVVRSVHKIESPIPSCTDGIRDIAAVETRTCLAQPGPSGPGGTVTPPVTRARPSLSL